MLRGLFLKTGSILGCLYTVNLLILVTEYELAHSFIVELAYLNNFRSHDLETKGLQTPKGDGGM